VGTARPARLRRHPLRAGGRHVEHGIPVIPKSATRERIADNLDLFGFSLSDKEVARIDGLSRR
jgi:hypothetical protein